MTTKIAPNVVAFCSWYIDNPKSPPDGVRSMRTELRALLAVARVASPALNEMDGMVPNWMRRSRVAGNLRRALARLERASRKGET